MIERNGSCVSLLEFFVDRNIELCYLVSFFEIMLVLFHVDLGESLIKSSYFCVDAEVYLSITTLTRAKEKEEKKQLWMNILKCYYFFLSSHPSYLYGDMCQSLGALLLNDFQTSQYDAIFVVDNLHFLAIRNNELY